MDTKFETTQLWKLNEAAAKKEGVRRSIYEIKCKKKINLNNKQEDDEWEIGKTYTGEWHNDLRDGYGVQSWSNKCKYEGEWKNDERNGFGVYWIPLQINPTNNNNNNNNQDDVTAIYTKTSIELSSYISKNVNNLLKIRDKLLIKNDNNESNMKIIKLHKQYEGEWKNNMKHGKGTFYYENGDKFEGMFINNLRNGYGIMYYLNGDKFEGDWKFDKKNGFGIYINQKQENIYIGYWMNDKKEGPGYYKYNHHKNKLYIAEWVNDIANCGYFVNTNDIINDIKYENAKKIFPKLGLIDSDYILTRQIKDIRTKRKLIRHLTIIDDIDQLFENDKQLKNKIIDIFDQIAVFQSREQYQINIQDLYDAIKDFNLPQVEKLNLMISKYCNDLGIKKNKKESIFIMTILDFSKIIYLLHYN